MPGQIFISYRREDSQYAAGRIFDRLSQHFGTDRIFMDIDTIELGVDFGKKIDEAVSSCDVVIAIIGRHWSDSTDTEDQKRLNNPDDFVRLELSTALKRDIHIIPVFIDGAGMPQAKDLPSVLKPLARRNGLEIRHPQFNADVEKLIKGLEEIFETEDAEETDDEQKIETELTDSYKRDPSHPETKTRGSVSVDDTTHWLIQFISEYGLPISIILILSLLSFFILYLLPRAPINYLHDTFITSFGGKFDIVFATGMVIAMSVIAQIPLEIYIFKLFKRKQHIELIIGIIAILINIALTFGLLETLFPY